jgi:two-component system sensor histidine kinase KdpD
VVEASSGEPVPVEPAGESVGLGDDLELCLLPGGLTPDDERVLHAFAGRITDVLDRRSLEEVARQAEARSRADQLRTAILRAVSHDLRTPLASIKASSTSLLQDDIAWTADEIQEFARTIDEEADRLTRLVEDLLDMSRIEAGAVRTATRAVGLDDAIAGALSSLSQSTERVLVHIASDLPGAVADPGLLERVIANLVANALDHTPDGTDVVVEAAATGRAVVRIIDHGPGIVAEERTAVFEAFQRLGDATPGGVGLGMAVARGFIEAMDGELLLDETPGGGLTVTLSLPLADTPSPIAEVR